MNMSRPSTIAARTERIMYLASMASNASAMEDYIRRLKALKNLRAKENALTDDETKVLDGLEDDIKQYLLSSEHLRSFTPETLDQHLYERTDAKRQIRTLKLRITALLLIALLAVVGAYMLTPGISEVRLRVSINTAIATGYMIGAYLFLTSHRKFSPAHQSAYRTFSIAFLIGSTISLINMTVTVTYNGIVPWANFWYVTTALYGTFALIYVAARQLARLYGIRSLAMKIWWVVPLAILGAMTLSISPWAWILGARSGLSSVGGIFAFVFSFHTAWLMTRIWSHASPLYKAPTKALGYAFMCTSVGWAAIVLVPILPLQIVSTVSIASSALFIIAVLFLIRAGYTLSKLSRS